MKNKKLIAAFLSVSMLMALGGCDKSESKKTDDTEESETTETTAEDTEPTETTETEESSEETGETEKTEDTEEPEESTKGTYYGNYAGDESKFSDTYDDLRYFATKLNESNGDLLYGFGRNDTSEDYYDPVWEYVLLVYDGNEVLAYHDTDGNIEQVEQIFYGYAQEEWKPEEFLFEYEDFMEYPFLDDFPGFIDVYVNEIVDPKTIDDVLPDGGYGGQVRGFSADMKYMYCQIGPEKTINKTKEECLDLKVGDKVKLDGEEMEVTSIEFREDEESGWANCYIITLGVIDEGGYFVAVHVDENGAADDMSIFSAFGNPTFSYYKLCKVPIAEDAEIYFKVYLNGQYKEDTTIKGSELSDYLNKWIDVCPSLTRYENGGVKVNGSSEIGYGIIDGMSDPARIENGELVYFNLMIWDW